MWRWPSCALSSRSWRTTWTRGCPFRCQMACCRTTAWPSQRRARCCTRSRCPRARAPRRCCWGAPPLRGTPSSGWRPRRLAVAPSTLPPRAAPPPLTPCLTRARATRRRWTRLLWRARASCSPPRTASSTWPRAPRPSRPSPWSSLSPRPFPTWPRGAPACCRAARPFWAPPPRAGGTTFWPPCLRTRATPPSRSMT